MSDAPPESIFASISCPPNPQLNSTQLHEPKARSSLATLSSDKLASGRLLRQISSAGRTNSIERHNSNSRMQRWDVASEAEAALGGDMDDIMDAVVKVFCTHTEPNFSLPWQRLRQQSSTSTGFVIEGHRILTNAHSVAYHTQVKLKRRGSDEKYLAKVLAISRESDLALLTVESESFWEGVVPVQFAGLPRLQESVTLIGYPIGGETISVTAGVVSRTEVMSYTHAGAQLLGIQIDAAINYGNSGGPAFNSKGECVGVAFQGLSGSDAENIGYVIPTSIAQHFIRDYERNGTVTGYPALGIRWQTLESPHIRKSLKMPAEQKGIMVRRVDPTSCAAEALKQFDVMTAVNGVAIANDGTVVFRKGERISFTHIVSELFMGDQLHISILRDGQPHDVAITLRPNVCLVPAHIGEQPPSYFIFAGLVFTPATFPYIRAEYGGRVEDIPNSVMESAVYKFAEFADQQIVMLAQLLDADINSGYDHAPVAKVEKVNGKEIRNLKELVEAVDACTTEYLEFDLEYNEKVVLPTEESRRATAEILKVHGIMADRSLDLVAVGAGATTPIDSLQCDGTA